MLPASRESHMRKMNRIAVFIACLSFVAIAAADDGDRSSPATDSQHIQGTWKVVKKVKNGEAERGPGSLGSITFTGNIASAVGENGETSEGNFTIDESKKPKWVTFKATGGPQAGRTFAALYKLEGDTLTIAYSTGEHCEVRPEDFSGKEGQAMEVLERQK